MLYIQIIVRLKNYGDDSKKYIMNLRSLNLKVLILSSELCLQPHFNSVPKSNIEMRSTPG